AQARMNVTRTMAPLINSVSRVMDFYNSRNPEHIEQAYIMGMGGDMSNLSKLLTNELGVPTKVFRKLEGIVWHPTVGDGDLFNYVACIGASMAPVSFIGSEKQQKQKKETNNNSLTVLVGVFFVVASAALAANGYVAYQEAKEEQKRLQGLESTYIPAEQVYQKYISMKTLYENVLMGHLMTNRPNDNILNFISELEEKLPADVSVLEFSSNDDYAVLRIQAADKNTTAGIIQTLRDFSSLQYVAVDSIQEVEEEAADEEDAEVCRYVEFTVSCTYYPNGYLPGQELTPQYTGRPQTEADGQQEEGQVE
ncbi:MAG: hypothetical protein K2L18_11300, partial [Acetatifactor sp.]|nr:hypothetical protein [Acetatifactor sp.]